jgi:4-amino-4-deoxy-L-arabinose transferase-like glycosyltransferase
MFKRTDKNYFILASLATFNLLVLFFVIKKPLLYLAAGDISSYVSAIEYLRGESVVPVLNRLLASPLNLYSVLGLSYITGSIQYAFLLLNSLFYFLTPFVFYRLALLIYKEKTTALFASILVLSNWCVYVYGTYYPDPEGWFFFVLGTYFALQYFYNRTDKKYLYLTAISSVVGFFFKEYGVLPMLTLGFLILLTDDSWKKKFNDIFLAGLALALPVIFYYVFFYLRYHYTYLDWYAGNINPPGTPESSLWWLIKTVAWTYLAGWPILVYGMYKEWKVKNRARLNIFFAMMPASLAFVIWPVYTQRLEFILVPLVALVSGYGLSKIRNKYLATALLSAYVILNYFIAIKL